METLGFMTKRLGDIGFGISDFGRRLSDFGCLILAFRFRMSAFGLWLSDVALSHRAVPCRVARHAADARGPAQQPAHPGGHGRRCGRAHREDEALRVVNEDTLALVRAAVQELTNYYPENVQMNPWWHVHWTINGQDEIWLAWWWRSINKIDIPTWHTLRVKVVELRDRKSVV